MSPRRIAALFGLALSLFATLGAAQNESRVDYIISLDDASHHRVHVSMTYDPESGGNDIQLPVWNALYQVRDFAKNVLAVKATSQSGEQLGIRQIDKSTWEIRAQHGWATVDYDIILDEAGPFGAQFNAHHAFLNFAELLMYPVNGRDFPITLRFDRIPLNWKMAIPLPLLSTPPLEVGSAPSYAVHAANYDQLVDSPCEIGEFAESDFEQNGAKYRVVVDAEPKGYDISKLLSSLKRITVTETEWMNDRPFDTYLFIYHFPNGPAAGGMEHAYSTAIDLSRDQLQDLKSLESVTAHEFFHLWNVKRIRPQSLEPIDYARENYTRALWFSEGTTSSVAQLVLLKAGLLQPAEYLQRLSAAITVLQSRPAQLFQSAEESSLNTWLERYPNYRSPERSISYYNKGEILGVLLDLKIRQDSGGRHSLRDLFKTMNRDYAKQGKFFADSDDVRKVAESLSGTDLHGFFEQYVAGTQELPYKELFATVGLVLQAESRFIVDPGFSAARNFGGPLTIDDVYGDKASTAGLRQGDEIVAIDGKAPAQTLDQQFTNNRPGTRIRIAVKTRGARKEVDLILGDKTVTTYLLTESPRATSEQLARRKAWLASENQISSGAS